MSYQVIARKWRPRDFQELVGQEHVSQTLVNALRHDRLHHALLFTGPRGTGKTSTARILAKALRCPEAKNFVPCHKCSECEEIAAGRSVNVIEIDGASNNGVDAIRELRETVGYRPSTGRHKLYIIDEVHMLSTSAFNALLKTLEEPPGHVIFVMATTEVQKIPETVLSRVQRFDFRCIPTRQIVQHLEKICTAENLNFDTEALWTLARQGAGSMRDSQSFLEQAITFTEGQLTAAKINEVLGLTDRSLLLQTLKSLIERDSKAIIEVLRAIAVAGYEAKLLIQDLLEEIRHLLLMKMSDGEQTSLIDLPDSEISQLKALSEAVNFEDIHLLFDMALKGAQDLWRAPDARIALEMTLLRMSAAPRVMQLEKWFQSEAPRTTASPSAQIQETTAAAPAATAMSTASTAASAPTASMSSAGPAGNQPNEAWAELVKRIQSVNSVIGAQLENCFLQSLQNKKIVLGVTPKMKFLFDKLTAPEFKKRVLNYVTTFWGAGYQLEVVMAEAQSGALTPKALAGQQEAEEKQRIRHQVESHPLVRSAQSAFKTEIRAIKESEK